MAAILEMVMGCPCCPKQSPAAEETPSTEIELSEQVKKAPAQETMEVPLLLPPAAATAPLGVLARLRSTIMPTDDSAAKAKEWGAACLAAAAAAAEQEPAAKAKEKAGSSTPKTPKKDGKALFEERRQRILTAEAEEEAALAAAAPEAAKAAAIEAAKAEVFVEDVSDGKWRVRGASEEKVMAAGLRWLEQDWNKSEDALLEFPKRKNGSAPLLMRETTFRELLSRKLSLKSLSANDVSAAQGDLKHLTLKQLLRLRVEHLEFNATGESHIAFLTSLESLLYLKLGQHASAQIHFCHEPDDPVLSKLGRDLMLLTAMAVPKEGTAALPSWWAWQTLEGQRIFFKANGFASVHDFPAEGGAAAVTDYSKMDASNRRWIEWQICLVGQESELSQPEAAGSGAAPISAAVLGDALGALKKTGSRPEVDPAEDNDAEVAAAAATGAEVPAAAAAGAKQKGAAALLKGLRSGEVAKIVDVMEEDKVE